MFEHLPIALFRFFATLLLNTILTFNLLSSLPNLLSIQRRLIDRETWLPSHGLLATLFALFQYAPQIHLTFTEKFVGALSIPTMCIQVPGSVLFVLSLAMREKTSWTCKSFFKKRREQEKQGDSRQSNGREFLWFQWLFCVFGV